MYIIPGTWYLLILFLDLTKIVLYDSFSHSLREVFLQTLHTCLSTRADITLWILWRAN